MTGDDEEKMGRLPDANLRREMERFIDPLMPERRGRRGRG